MPSRSGRSSSATGSSTAICSPSGAPRSSPAARSPACSPGSAPEQHEADHSSGGNTAMKALVSQSYGPVDELELVEIPVPAPGPGQVQVKVAAAALNPLDVILITGRLRQVLPVEHPFVPGMDAA